MINVPTHAMHTTAPINRNAIVRLLGKRHATAIIAGNNEVLPITIQSSGGVCRKSIKAEKAKRTTAKTKQSQPAMSGKVLRDVFNSATPKVMRAMYSALYSIERTCLYTRLGPNSHGFFHDIRCLSIECPSLVSNYPLLVRDSTARDISFSPCCWDMCKNYV